MDARSRAEALPGIARTPISPTSNNQFASGTLHAKDSFLPSADAHFQLDERQEVFASYARNIAMFQGGFKLGPQAVSQVTWDSQDGLVPEESRSFELGYRWIGDAVQLSLAAYHVQFDNSLLQYNPWDSRQPVGPTCGNRFYNVGGVDSRGAEVTVLWSPNEQLRWYTVPEGALYYASSRRRRIVVVDDDSRARVEAAVGEVRRLLVAGTLPLPLNDDHCRACSLRDLCQPEAVARSAKRSAVLSTLFELED